MPAMRDKNENGFKKEIERENQFKMLQGYKELRDFILKNMQTHKNRKCEACELYEELKSKIEKIESSTS